MMRQNRALSLILAAMSTLAINTCSDDGGGSDVDCDEPLVGNLEPRATWQWQLTGTIDTSFDVEMYDIDLFEAPQATIDRLHAAGRTVICYFSAGSWEEWRPDADEFPPDAIGAPLAGWPGEYYLDIRMDEVREIMKERLDLAVRKQCDGVEPDNVDAYTNPNGLGLTADDQLDYNHFLAVESHARGLSVGLKNDVGQIDALEPCFDWALNEECMAYSECGEYDPFLDSAKPVFHVEYVDKESQGPAKAAEVCGDPSIDGFSTLIKTWDLDAWVIPCTD